MSKIDKRLENTIPADSLDLNNPSYVGRVFRMVRYNELTVVRLVKVKSKVYLEHVQGDRKDGFSLSLSEFRKFYHMVRTRADVPVEQTVKDIVGITTDLLVAGLDAMPKEVKVLKPVETHVDEIKEKIVDSFNEQVKSGAFPANKAEPVSFF